MTKQAIARAMKQLEARMADVAKVRDKLDDTIREVRDDLETLRDDCQEAHENLQCARDALSRLV